MLLKLFLAAAVSAAAMQAHAQTAPQITPSGETLTPLAAPGASFVVLNPHLPQFPDFLAGQAVSSAKSPDGRTLAVLTSGYNRLDDATGKQIAAASGEYVFIYDISHGQPVQLQALHVQNTYMGLAFSPDGSHLYVSGGEDDNVHIFAKGGDGWAEQGAPILLGHLIPAHGHGEPGGGLGLATTPAAAGIGVTADGTRLLVANFENDSASLIDLTTRKVNEIPLRPGLINKAQTAIPGGEYPFDVVVRGNRFAYVSAARDREIDVLQLQGMNAHVIARIKVAGNPGKMVLNRAGTRLFVASGNDGEVAEIDTTHNRLLNEIAVTAPAPFLPGAGIVHGTSPNSVALSADERTLYVTDGGTNALSVVSLAGRAPKLLGLVPTGFYPNAVTLSADGKWLYVANSKSIAGPNPGMCQALTTSRADAGACQGHDQYVLQLLRAGLLTMPVPDAAALPALTRQVAMNDFFLARPSARDAQVMAALHQRIKHIIYIIRENRSYDQILGDLGEGNGDSALTEFGAAITPNAHALAKNFVDIDNFYDPGDVSGDGWQWSTEATEPDLGIKNMPLIYAGRGLSYDFEGTNRDINVALTSMKARSAADPVTPNDPNLLPGQGNVMAPDGPHGQYQRGYIWDAAVRAGLTIRNYGFYVDMNRYHLPASEGGLPPVADPFAAHLQVAYGANPTLAPVTDPYFRGFDNNYPDVLREAEWQREFDGYVAHHDLPNLEFVRLMHDHLGSFNTAMMGVNTPERQVADNDWAIGKLIAAVAHSPYADSTLIFVIEDDSQDGPDHEDAHRSVAFIAGPYVRHGGVVSTRYSTVNMIRTIEDILGMTPLSIQDAYQPPMTDLFDLNQKDWTYNAIEPAPLTLTQLPQPQHAEASWRDSEPASWWAQQTAHYDWNHPDDIPTDAFDRLLWNGLHKQGAYPVAYDASSDDD